MKFSTFADLDLMSVNSQVEFDLIKKRVAQYVLGMQTTVNNDILLNLQFDRNLQDENDPCYDVSVTASKVLE